MSLEGREVDRVLGSIGFTWFLSTCSIHNTSKLGCKDIIHQATLKILDKNKQPDIRFPEVPKVKTDIPVLKNEIVAIVLMYGECKPYIIGRCF